MKIGKRQLIGIFLSLNLLGSFTLFATDLGKRKMFESDVKNLENPVYLNKHSTKEKRKPEAKNTSPDTKESVTTATETDVTGPGSDAMTSDNPTHAPLNIAQGNWVFSGMVTNEHGEHYSYYFQINREGKVFHAVATLLDPEKKSIFWEEESATITTPEATYYRVGNAFLKFNEVNNTWIFGVQTKEKKGFNFKVDMLSQAGNALPAKNLRPGIKLRVSQTGRLNGHIQIGGSNEEQFVTSQTAWFRQVWITKPQEKAHVFSGVLCQFTDGSAFYALNLPEEDALRGAIAGWRDPDGKTIPMSQFVTTEAGKDGDWLINIRSPKKRLLLPEVLIRENGSKQWIAGLTDKTHPGFCVINNDKIGDACDSKAIG
ncbi:MAG: hypothetical protein H2069_03485 [Legionella sp.]|nr:hypothetical protein [Legionella sp.]